jgi:hypothetical protein
MKHLPWILATALSLGSGARALAEPRSVHELSEERFHQGRAAYRREDYPLALKLFRQSQDLEPSKGKLLNIALCEEQLGRLATAMEHLQKVLPDFPAEDERLAIVNEHIAALDPRLPHLRIKLAAGALPGAVVMLDGVPLAPEALGKMTPIDPGKHVILVGGKDLAERQFPVTVREGESTSVVVEPGRSLAPAPPPPVDVGRDAGFLVGQAPPPETETGTSGRRVATYIAGGVGVAGIVFGAVTGGLMLSKKSVVNAKCNDAGTCVDRDGVDEANSAKALASMSTAGWAVALAGVGTATFLFFTEPPRSKAPVKKGALQTQVKTSRLSVNVGPVGMRGGLIEIGGAW